MVRVYKSDDGDTSIWLEPAADGSLRIMDMERADVNAEIWGGSVTISSMTLPPADAAAFLAAEHGLTGVLESFTGRLAFERMRTELLARRLHVIYEAATVEDDDAEASTATSEEPTRKNDDPTAVVDDDGSEGGAVPAGPVL
jgi:hypothetical protein